MVSIGVDIGGTFTDLVVYEPHSGSLRGAKVLSTPDDPAAAVLTALRKAAVDLDAIDRFVHGTTRVTNALIEGSMAPVGVLTTRGFRDVLEMRRGHRPRLYSAREAPRAPLVPRWGRWEVTERILADGSVETPLHPEDVVAAADAMVADGIGDVAVCFLHSYSNPEHEKLAASILADTHPELRCTLSSEVVPEPGEYERFSTTVLNVGVAPLVADYLQELRAKVTAGGHGPDLFIMTSQGGTVSVEAASRFPVNLALSGPAGGVTAAAYLARRRGTANAITCDIGGTSTDVCLIADGTPVTVEEGAIAGHPNKHVQIEISTIGAGGGSLVWIDRGGELRIGPRSAGSHPGPACYGNGGTEPTVTDAHLVLGHLDTEDPLGGELVVRRDLAMAALQPLAERLGLDEVELAAGVVRIAAVKITSAIKEISVSRGRDPRDFTLVAYGGAGPMYACAVAGELGINEVVIPPVAGTFSALGFVVAQARRDLVSTVTTPVDQAGLARCRSAFDALAERAIGELGTAHGIAPGDVELRRTTGMRLRGQSYDLAVPFDPVPDDPHELVERFIAVYQRRYAYLPTRPVPEILKCRLTALGPEPDCRLAGSPGPAPSDAGAWRPVYADGRWHDSMVWSRHGQPIGTEIAGPALVRETDSTTVVEAGWKVRWQDDGSLSILREPGR